MPDSVLTPLVDIHCHVLPAWDDGPRDLNAALEMARRAAQAGMTTLVATPHVGRAFRGEEKAAALIQQGVENLQREIDAQKIPIRIVPGAEVMLGKVDVRVRLPKERELSYAGKGKHVLVESPTLEWPPFGRTLVDFLLGQGLIPVLAHPERYVNVQKDPTILDSLVNSGALVQLTADAILGNMGKPIQATCRTILSRGWTAFVASDAHGTRENLPINAVNEVVSLVGEEAARQIFVDNPQRLLDGQRIFPPVPEPPQKSGFFGRLMGKR